MESRKKKRVLFLIHTLGGGGAERVLVNLVSKLNPNKYDITVMTLVDVGSLRYALPDYVKYKTTIPLRFKSGKKQTQNKSGSLLASGGALKQKLAKFYAFVWKFMPAGLIHTIFVGNDYDVEVAFLEGITAKVIAGSKNRHSKKVAWIHVDLKNQTKSSGVFRNFKDEEETYRRFDRIACVSEVVRERFVEKFEIDKRKVYVKYNLIDQERIRRMGGEKAEKLKRQDGRLLIGSVGRLNHQKGYDRLVRVLKRLKDDGKKVSCCIVGEGTGKDDLEDYLEKNGLDGDVELMGFKANPFPIVKQFDLFVCSSRAEGFSTSVVEAMTLGVPVLSTECSGAKEILGYRNEYGLVVENSEEGLYKGLRKMLDNPELIEEYREKIRERSTMFSDAENLRSVEELLDGC